MPYHEFIAKIVKKRSISATIVILLLFLLILVPVFFLLVSLADQTYQLYAYIQNNMEALKEIPRHQIFDKLFSYINLSRDEFLVKVSGRIQNSVVYAFKSLTPFVSLPINFIVSFFFMLLMLFFLLKDAYKLEKPFYKILPFPEDIERDVINKLVEAIKVLMAGNLLIMFLQGLMVGLGLYFADFQMPLLWGSIAAILSLIPVVGTTFIWIPAVIYLLLTNSFGYALFLSIWCIVWYLLLENLLKPKIFGKKLNFHPMIIFFLLLGSIKAFGLPGVILGPLLLTLFYSLWDIYKLLREYDKKVADE